MLEVQPVSWITIVVHTCVQYNVIRAEMMKPNVEEKGTKLTSGGKKEAESVEGNYHDRSDIKEEARMEDVQCPESQKDHRPIKDVYVGHSQQLHEQHKEAARKY